MDEDKRNHCRFLVCQALQYLAKEGGNLTWETRFDHGPYGQAAMVFHIMAAGVRTRVLNPLRVADDLNLAVPPAGCPVDHAIRSTKELLDRFDDQVVKRLEVASSANERDAQAILSEVYKQLRDIIDRASGELKKVSESELPPAVPWKNECVQRIESICRNFSKCAHQLMHRHHKRPSFDINDEYDVQDLLQAILRIDFADVRPEEWTPSYGGTSARMDFLLKREKTVVEVKKTREGLGQHELGDQLLIDIARYQEHPSCRTLICFVYDPDHRLNNAAGIENDLSQVHANGMQVQVIISG